MSKHSRCLAVSMTACVLALFAFGCAKEPVPVAETKTAAPAPPVETKAEVAATAPLEPELVEALEQLALWEGDFGRLVAARENAKSVLKRDKNNATAWAVIAKCEYLAGYLYGTRFDQEALSRASKFANHALSLEPDNFEAHMVAGQIAAADTDYDLARQHLEKIPPERRGDPRIKSAEMRIADLEGDRALALRLARELSAFSTLADIYDDQGLAEDSDAARRAQIAAFPDSAWAHGNYAMFLLDRGDVDAAIAEAERAVKLKPYPNALGTLSRAYATKAELLWNQRRFEEAGAYIEKIARLRGGESPETHVAIGRFYERAGRELARPEMLARARASYEAALRMRAGFEPAVEGIERLEKR
jgi:tetratricopeptide (TPR) repeat protein